jgi:hypothetical protein
LPSWAPRLNAISISYLTAVADTVDVIVTPSLTPLTQHALRRACDIGIELGAGHLFVSVHIGIAASVVFGRVVAMRRLGRLSRCRDEYADLPP